jgi:pyruvate/2-oxoglutarate dehydrogenase complex dihydrolipoamide dehydrogenase (E3) component
LQEEKFDLIVIGSGSGLGVAHAAVTQNGLKVGEELVLTEVVFHQSY